MESIRFDGIIWPIDDGGLGWKLIFTDTPLTVEERVYLHHVAAAYVALVHEKSIKNRNYCCKRIREKYNEIQQDKNKKSS